ncbi:MAG: hypothetical protein K2P57_03780 [Burkholderiales bacterium]|nr:hypothetical protein [Burkholderiales bacterium]
MASDTWRFFRAGGFDQVRLETGAELAALGSLDPKLWVALSCPTRGIEFDSGTIDLIDTDGDGHIRAQEIIEAGQWAAGLLNDPEWLVRGTDTLPLSAIEGDILGAAKHILKALGKAEAGEISLSDCVAMREIFAGLPFNGDGIVPPEAAKSESQRQTMQDILDSMEEKNDPPGISQAMIDTFFAEIAAYASWIKAADSAPEILPLAENTEQAAQSWLMLKDKAEDYFRRCRIAEYEPRAALLVNRPEQDFIALASRDLSHADEDIAAFPIAAAAANKPLPLMEAVNPLWMEAASRFHDFAVLPLLGEQASLTERQWRFIASKLQPYENWQSGKPAVSIEKLGKERILALASGDEKSGLDALVMQDMALEPEMKAIASVEKLLRYCRDLSNLANNFVSFRDFYTRRGKAIFQAGTLYLDGRSCELCVSVDDVAKHAALATLSRICLVYCECRRGAEKMTIAAAFTAGDSDQLMTGRNGVFYDRKGLDWDASIIRIIEHPISIGQAFMAPYKTIGKMVGEQIQKIAASRSRAVQESTAKSIIESGKAESKQAFDVGKFAGIFAAIGLAVGAIGTALASVVTGLLGLKFWQLPFALLFLTMAVSGPSMLIAWLKLRQRNLGPILDANGWAINSRAKINIPFGTSLTEMAKLPEGSQRALTDPYAEQKRTWVWYVLAILAGCAALAWVYRH